LNKLIAYDEYLLSLPNAVGPDNPASIPVLRRDVAIADALIAQLQQLPPCNSETAATPIAASAMSSAPAQPPSSGTVPEPSPSPAEAKATPEPAPVAAQLAALGASAPVPPNSDRLVIRFDDKIAALTPSGIRAFNEAMTAVKSGKPVQLTIEGCDANADFSSGAPCARRLYSLENRLKDAGVKNPRRLFADLP
jgi:hypothetical protein